jgi:hypothetical protein
MLHSRFFLIEAQSRTSVELAQYLAKDALLLCCSPQLMSHEFGDKSGWTEQDMCLVVKLAYLAQTLDIFQEERERAYVFGAANISEAVFDRWWSIKPIEYLGRTVESSQELKLFACKLDPGDRPMVATWLRQVIDA